MQQGRWSIWHRKTAGEEGVELARHLKEAVFSCKVISPDGEESFILILYEGKGEALDRGNYRGFKLIDHVMKLLERVLDPLHPRYGEHWRDAVQFCTW